MSLGRYLSGGAAVRERRFITLFKPNENTQLGLPLPLCLDLNKGI